MSGFPEPPNEFRTLELVERMRADDPAAWNELYALYRDELLLTARLELGPKLRACLDSEDVLQSAALAAFRALPGFEHRGDGSLRAFLHRLVRNTIRDRADWFAARKRSGGVPLTDSLAEQLADRAPRYQGDGRFERLERALSALPDDMRAVIVLRRLEGLSSAQAAERLGRSDDATRKLYSRAIARLSRLMADGGAP